MIFAIWQIIFKMENITTFPSQSDYLICLVNHAWPNSLSFFKDLIYLISKTISICKWKFFKSSRHAYESMNWFCRSSIISSWYYELNDIIDIRCIYTCHIIYLKLHFYFELYHFDIHIHINIMNIWVIILLIFSNDACKNQTKYSIEYSS